MAAFMDLALYDPDIGYYARAAQRSGRAGDFFTSVDVGPIFGELLEAQIAEMAKLLDPGTTLPAAADPPPFDLVEAGAGNGRLAADILRAARHRDPAWYGRVRLHLVEASASARAAQLTTLSEVAERLASTSAILPDRFEGVLIANELLDAFPVHHVVMREDGLRELFVDVAPDADAVEPAFVLVEGAPSTPALAAYLERLGIGLESGWRAEINLRAVDWIRNAARRLVRGFIVLIDYGHDARHLYSPSHARGTLTTFARHTTAGPDTAAPGLAGFSEPAWLQHPGEQDITAQVDFTSVREAAESEGLTQVAFLDQTYFLMGILASQNLQNPGNRGNPGDPGNFENPGSPGHLRRSMALKTLLMPGGLGSTHKVLILGKGVGTPALRGGSFGGRVT
ncbi:MAG TPA: SAM-dependent methyltransferase [Vicinamibacterales bacterium]|nr:SAM-dependent methyltransferase [Vicinamibacterales bacterium]